MADKNDTPTPATTPDAATVLAQALTDALNANAPTKYIKYGKHDLANVFNPRGLKSRPLRRACYQNGMLLQERQLHDSEIDLLNKLTPGVYFDGLVTVVEQADGTELMLRILYRNRTADQRQELASRGAYTFTHMLQVMVDAGIERDAAVKAARQAEVRAALNEK